MKRLGNGAAWDLTGRFLTTAALICGGVMGLLIVCANLLNLAENISPKGLIFYPAAGICMVLAAVVLCRMVPAKSGVRFCVCLAAAAFAVRWLMVMVAPAQPVSDFQIMYDAACGLARGNNVMNDSYYFHRWPYQSAFVAWMALWIRLFGADVFFFQMTNCLCGAGTAVLVYGLARRFASPQGARAAGVLYLLYPGSVLLAPVLTNQHLSELLLLAALYLAAGEGKDLRRDLGQKAAAGLLLALSNAVRPSAVVAVLGSAAVLLLTLFRWKELGRAELLSAAAGTLTVIGVYFLVGEGLSWLVRVTELNRNGLVSNVPQWKFILGLNQETAGEYSQADADIVFASDQLNEIQAAAGRLLKERLAALTPGRLLALFWEKIKGMWGDFEPVLWAFTQDVTDLYAARGQGEALAWALGKFERIAGGLCIAGSLLIAAGCVRAALETERGREVALLLTLTALAYFCVHLFIEIQTRYRTLLFAVAMPLAAIGADGLGSLAGRLLARWKEKRKEIQS